ncbi:MAG: FeoB-associated Cys-rich membrane protein [Dysgonomonas sp.]
MVQEVVVVLIGIVVALIVLRKVYSFFFSKNQQKGSCGCSSCGCNTVKKIK